jgi:hypothetical protein
LSGWPKLDEAFPILKLALQKIRNAAENERIRAAQKKVII